ncbi:MAG: hypothetical protein EBV15_04245 [Bacteroidetes bacterium]|jgi:hypothetical protein|nr:hypothetical protein [Bacteroidota bacterium]
MNKSFVWVVTLGLNTLAAQSIELKMPDRGTDAEFTKTMMMANVFELRGDSVANPLDFASAKVSDATVWKKVKSPAMSKTYRKGFTWIFSAVKTDDFAANHTLLLIENPGWTAYNTLIWTDRNHNYDLTDDGPPDTIKPNKKFNSNVVVSIDNKPNGYKVMLEHFPVSQFKQFAVMNDKAMYQLQGNRLFSGTENSFRIRRMNVLYGTWSVGSEQIAICVKDANCNGNYADNGLDEVMIADDGNSFQNLQSCTIKNGKAYLEWNSAAFFIDFIHPDGQYIKLRRDTTVALKYILNIGQKCPRFRYDEPTAREKTQKRRIRKFKGQPLYIYIWNDQSNEYISDSAVLHSLGRLKNAGFKILMLNFGASSQYLHRYSSNYETQIYQGFSSSKINNRLKIRNQIPIGILLDNRQRVIKAGIRPSQVVEYLKIRHK